MLISGEPLYCAEETDPVALCNEPNRPSYLVPDSLDCSIFYYCTDLGNERFGAEKMVCQVGDLLRLGWREYFIFKIQLTGRSGLQYCHLAWCL